MILALFLLQGSLGLKSPAECDNLQRRSAAIECYHLAGMTYAYLQDSDNARNTCNNIWSKYGLPGGYKDDDITKKAELETNNCFMDIARIIGDETLCDYIQNRRGDFTTKLVGEVSTLEMCKDSAMKAASIKPANYFNTPAYQNSLCSLLFIFPPLLVGVFRFSKR